MRQLKRTLVLIMDERSMISSEILGAAARNCKETAHGGVNHELSWGGIPVVIVVGDDHQLPPVEKPGGKGKGAFYVLDGTDHCVNRNWGSNIETLGHSQFLELSTTVEKLTMLERQKEDDEDLTELLRSLRPPRSPDKHQVDKLLSLDIRRQPPREREHIITNSLHVYAYTAKARDWNNKCIVAHSNENNPVAMLKTKGRSSITGRKTPILSHFKMDNLKLANNQYICWSSG